LCVDGIAHFKRQPGAIPIQIASIGDAAIVQDVNLDPRLIPEQQPCDKNLKE
jgi:hypothetical protein